MNQIELLSAALYFVALLFLVPPLGLYMARLFQGERTFLTPLIAPLERLVYRSCRIDQYREMTWKRYLLAVLTFNAVGLVAVIIFQMVQAWLPLNPNRLPNVPFPLAFNIAVSFITNTNWQAYAGEITMSYGTQMMALAVQNFLSAASGIAVALALIRGLTRTEQETIGNFWVDTTRATLFLLLPISIILALIFVGQGSVQTFSPTVHATSLESGTPLAVPLGPVASQAAIKHLGTNGGGFFGASSTHPFENPTPLTNFLQMLAILAIPASLPITFGIMAGNSRQGWALFGAMLILFLAGFATLWWSSHQPNPAIGLSASLEGKEMRFGIGLSSLFTNATTASSCGSVAQMHDSLSPLAGMVALTNMMLGEIIFGGVGSGLYGILLFAILTVFIAGLMVGRTPEYLGKKIEAREITWTVVAILGPACAILIGTAIGCVAGLSSLGNKGPHGFSEILYAFTSCIANNGSAFSGLNADTDFYNFATAIAMLVGRYAILAPVLIIAGRLAAKKASPPSLGTFPTTGFTFSILLILVILIVGGLTFFPALCLGPMVEHLLMQAGRTF